MTESVTESVTESMTESMNALVDRFVDAIERGDVETVLSIYAEDALIWHNFDQIEVTPQDNARQIRWFSSRLAGMKYEDIRRMEFPGGLVQQHVLRGTAPNGEAIAVYAILRIDIVNGRITRLEEYLDPAQAAALSAPGKA